MKQRSPAVGTQTSAPPPSQAILNFYAAPSAMTSPGRHAALFARLPREPAAIARIVQGLLIYEHVAREFYGVAIPEARRNESHIRPLERMLDALLALDGRPLDVARPEEKRLVGICRHFTLLAVAMMRAQGIAARARVGFGAYFNPGFFEDHWVCEYWNAAEGRWVLVDAQLDEVWKGRLRPDFDVLDVPRDRFLTAADAWDLCRQGKADAPKFGIIFGGFRGLWFVAGNLVHDLSALNKAELLPWDVWGARPQVNATFDDDQIAFFDR
ncbi:MAG TPA: transglutaminase-like domain-containing protein, partial [Stellaceae bacterium]|nr:transglutaminase-like domain-containing protein [Stellaceae bacterium]